MQDDGHASSRHSSSFLAHHDRGLVDDNTAAKALTNKRSRFNLLNPMSLLARRRSSQNTNKLEEVNLNVKNLHVPAIPDNVPTSIRGNIVHDFSVPKARRINNENSPRPGPLPSPSYPRKPSDVISPVIPPSASTPTSVHSPMFKEHFQEDRRPARPMNTAYLHGQNLQVPPSGAIPSFAKRLPVSLPDNDHIAIEPDATTLTTTNEQTEKNKSLRPPEPDLPPPPPPARMPSPVLELPPIGALPKHMTSTSSRFSFQIGQQGSIAQEKFLEEKHKEQAAKRPEEVRLSIASVDDMEGYDDYENGIDEEDGFDTDEIILKNVDKPSSQVNKSFPGMVEEDYHDDDDDDDFDVDDIVIRNIDVPTSQTSNREEKIGQFYQQPPQAIHFASQPPPFNLSTADPASQSVSYDSGNLVADMTKLQESAAYAMQPGGGGSTDFPPDTMFFGGLGISTASQFETTIDQGLLEPHPFDDSDLYFDDGEFDDQVIEAVNEFDEDTLDDAAQIRDIPAENTRKYEEALQRSLPGDIVKVVSVETASDPIFNPSMTSSLVRAGMPLSNHRAIICILYQYCM